MVQTKAKINEKKDRRIKVALVGSRGIPGKYGGNETFVHEVSTRLKGIFDIYVTCETNGFKSDEYNGVKRLHIRSFHSSTLTIPSIHDIISTIYLLHKVKDIDVIIYVAPDAALSAVLAKLAKKKVIINTDGIEWKRLLIRKKYVPIYLKPLYSIVALYMLFMEFLSTKIADIVIADSIGIEMHLKRIWRAKNLVYVAYGITLLPKLTRKKIINILKKFDLKNENYYLTVGRIVAENGYDEIIESFNKAGSNKKLVIVGPYNERDPYIKYLFKISNKNKNILFTGGIYNKVELAALRSMCFAYLHNYEVGGTNPSLLEQLQYDRPIIAKKNAFHLDVLHNEGLFFNDKDELIKIMKSLENKKINVNYKIIRKRFSWNKIAIKYANLIKMLILRKNKKE